MPKQEIIDQSTGEIVPVNVTQSPAVVMGSFGDIVAAVISEKQFSILSGKTPKDIIRYRPGKGGKTFAYVPHGYVTSTLNKAFGFDWDWRILPNGAGDSYTYHAPMSHTVKGKTVERPGSIIVKGELTVRIRNPQDLSQVIATITREAFGEKEEINGMTWGAHVKSAASDALKKAATLIGIALDLYYAEPDEVVPDLPPVPALTAEQLTLAREIKASGKNYGQVAGALSEHFKVEITREQVIEALG